MATVLRTIKATPIELTDEEFAAFFAGVDDQLKEWRAWPHRGYAHPKHQSRQGKRIWPRSHGSFPYHYNVPQQSHLEGKARHGTRKRARDYKRGINGSRCWLKPNLKVHK